MSKIKPIEIELKSGLIVGIILLSTALIGIVVQWKEFYGFVAPNGTLLNWRFFLIMTGFLMMATWFAMNHFWQREYNLHEITKKDRDNLKEQLKISENERLTDVITGIPNSRSLEKDIEDYFSILKKKVQLQFILIDLKDFRKVNAKFGFNKTNNLLRMMAQSIYKRMRRNEDMYKYSIDNSRNKDQEGFYRVYPGGDEFVFIIEGDQADAIGFSNRLVAQFEELSKKTQEILGEHLSLSFHCAIVEMDHRDTFEDIFKKAEDCYRISKEGKSRFNICWHPNTVEQRLSGIEKKKYDYRQARKVFNVMTIVDGDY